jgi:DNA polymerase III subunit delta'
MVSEPFANIIGQSQAIELLTQAIQLNRIAPAYLFVGTAGVGRKLVAQAFLRALLQAELGAADALRSLDNHPDITWVEPTYSHQGKFLTAAELQTQGIELPKTRPQVRLDQVRGITRFLSQSPMELSRLMVVIEEAETMGEAAANGLLKTLEEPGRGMLILLAGSKDSLLSTIVSRCQPIPFQRLSIAQMQVVLQQLGRADILEQPVILQMAQGSPGAALQWIERLELLPSELVQLWQQPLQSPKQCLEIAQRIDKSLNVEMQLWLLDYLQQGFWRAGSGSQTLKAFELAKKQLLAYVQPRLVWEVTLLQLLEKQPTC